MKLKLLLAVFVAAIPLAGCVLETPSPAPSPTPAVAPTVPPQVGNSSGSGPVKQTVIVGGASITQYSTVPPLTIDSSAQYTAVIRTNMGSIEIELFAGQAPITVNNFIFLANDGFYNGAIFHRVIPSFMIQGGDPLGTGTGGPGYRFQDEFVASLTFDQPGILAMANSGPGTNGSQFFVTTVPTPHLNGAHTIFGKIVKGQDVADAISLAPSGAGNMPLTPIVIQGIEITKNP